MGFFSSLKRQLGSVQVQYLGGHPDAATTGLTGLESDGDNLLLCGGSKWEPFLTIPKADIISLTLERSDTRSAGKAAAGAIIGGALTGGVGVVAGAALGGRKKDNSVIVLKVKYGAAEVDLLFSSGNTKQSYSLVASLLK